MLYLISNWCEESALEEDRIYTLSNFFFKQSFDNKVVLLNHVPFLHYKLNEHGYDLKNIISVFDIFQTIKKAFGFPIGLEDLSFPEELEQVYLSDRMLLMKADQLVGRVLFNAYGFVSKVRYLKENGAFTEDVYDDRGFISAKYYGSEREETDDIYTVEYFNELGEHTLTQVAGQVFVEIDQHPYLKKRQYTSLDEAVNEVVNCLIHEAVSLNPETQLSIITTTEKEILQKTKDLAHNGKLIRIMTEDAIHHVEKSRIVADSKMCRKLKGEQKAMPYLPIFTPKLNLGSSDSVPLMTLHLKLSDLATSESMLLSMIERVIKDDTLSLVCEVDNLESASKAKLLQTTSVDQHFEIDSDSDTYESVETYIKAKKEGKLFKHQSEAVADIQKTSEWEKYVGAVLANSRIDYQIQANRQEVENAFHVARLYIDFENKYNMLRHAQAVSAGVPIISRHASDFIINGKNGFVLKPTDEVEELHGYIDHFIHHLKHWNKALVCAVDIIETYEPAKMIEKWQEVLS